MKNVCLCVLLFLFIACHSQQGAAQKLKPDSFETGIAQAGIQILDVRTSGEYQSGHIKNALLADWNNKQQFNDRIQYVDKNKPVYVYCLAGGRSAAAANWMRENGFTDVKELDGGMNAWKMANKPVEGQSNEPQMTIEQYWSSIPTDKTVLVDFGATWCPPCIKMQPVLDDLQKMKELHFQLIKIDAGVQTTIMKELNIEPIPVFIVYKNGKEVWRKQGVVSKDELATAIGTN